MLLRGVAPILRRPWASSSATSRRASGCGASRIPPGARASDWEPEVASFAVESRGVALLLDPLAPPPGARDVWARIDALRPERRRRPQARPRPRRRPVRALVRRARVRAAAVLARRRAARPSSSRCSRATSCPAACWRSTTAAGCMETPVYLPEQRALVFADGMTAPDGELRVWATPWHERARRCRRLRALLALAVRARARLARRARARPGRRSRPPSSASRGRSGPGHRIGATLQPEGAPSWPRY